LQRPRDYRAGAFTFQAPQEIMRVKLLPAAALAAGLSFPLLAGTLPPETPIIVEGALTVDAADIEGYFLRIPPERRAEIRGSKDRIATIADNIFIARSLAAKARALGLDKDITVQRRLTQVQDGVLADLYMQHVEKNAPAPNLEPRARELYISNTARFTVPEQVHVQHLLVGLNGRTREMAEERARQIYEEAKSGKEDFLALAARLSDDPDKKRNGGDMGYGSPSGFVAPLSKRIATMTTKGEISEPVESHFGFHIVRFMDRQKERVRPFEDVKKSIIAEEKERLAKKRSEEVVTQLRSSSTVIVNLDKLEALVNPIDDVLSRAAAEGARSGTEAPKAR
jgi:parvulin-like peptidyl-prolyl isomerase